MDEAMFAIANALAEGASINDIHQAFLAKFVASSSVPSEQYWTEDNIFLAIKGGEILFAKRQEKPEPDPADVYRFKRSEP